MTEIRGYIELDKYTNQICHSEDLALNSGRNCLRLLIREKGIRRILPLSLLSTTMRNMD
jgi:hypothetical protein